MLFDNFLLSFAHAIVLNALMGLRMSNIQHRYAKVLFWNPLFLMKQG